MALQKTVIDIPFGGLETKVDPKLVPTGKSLVLENAEFDTLGAISKRNGYTALPRTIEPGSGDGLTVGGSLDAGHALFEHDGELLLSDKSRLYAKTPAGWADKGTMIPVGVATERVGSSIPASANATAAIGAMYSDCAVANGVAVYLWESNVAVNGLLTVTIADVATGAHHCSSVAISGSAVATSRLVASGNYIYILWTDGAGAISLYTINTTDIQTSITALSGAATSLKSDSGGGYALDVAPFDASGKAICAYETSGVAIGVFKFDSSGVIAGGVTIAENPTDRLCVITTSASRVMVGWMVGANFRAITYDSALSIVTAAATVRAGTAGTTNIVACEASDGDVLFFYQWDATSGGLTFRIIGASRLNPTGTVDTAGLSVVYGGHMNIASKPFLVGSTVFIMLGYSAIHTTATSVQSTYFLFAYDNDLDQFSGADDGQLKCVARILPGEAVSEERIQATELPRPSSVYSDGLGGYLTSAPAMFSQNLILDTASPQPGVASIAFDFTAMPVAASLGENLYIASGQLYEYDGRKATENNFNLYPEIGLLADSGAGSLADGTYQVAIIYGQFDAHGQITLSAPSVAGTVVTAGANSAIAVTCRDPRATLRENYIIFYYLTEVGGSSFYEAAVDINVNEATFTAKSLTTTTGLTNNRILYTTGGILENIAPPAFQSVVAKGNRLYGVTSDGVLWIAKARIAGETVAFSDALTVDFGRDGGRSYALAVMDGVVYMLGERSIRAIAGTEPGDTGANGTLSDPQDIASPVGRLAGSPVATTAEGVFFKAVNGIWRLSRSRSVEYVGAPVEAYASLTMTSAVVVPGKSQIRFGHSDGVTLVYDYIAGQWSVFTNHPSVGAAVWDDDYCWLTADGRAYQQSAGFVDDSTPISMVVETPWIKLSGIQGYQRLYCASLLGEWRSDHTLTLKVYYDYNPDVAETVMFAATGAAQSYVAGEPLQIRHHLGKACQAVKFRVEDSNQAGTKESFRLTGISLELGGIGGVFRQGAGKTV